MEFNIDPFATAKNLNLALALGLFGIAIIGVVFMRGRAAFELSGRYALWGLVFLTGGGLVAAVANSIPGQQEVLAYVALALRVVAFIYLSTHIIFNYRRSKRGEDKDIG